MQTNKLIINLTLNVLFFYKNALLNYTFKISFLILEKVHKFYLLINKEEHLFLIFRKDLINL